MPFAGLRLTPLLVFSNGEAGTSPTTLHVEVAFRFHQHSKMNMEKALRDKSSLITQIVRRVVGDAAETTAKHGVVRRGSRR